MHNHSIQCDTILLNIAIDYQLLIAISMNSSFSSFVSATTTRNDYLSDIFMNDFTADQSGVRIAVIDTSFQVITEFKPSFPDINWL